MLRKSLENMVCPLPHIAITGSERNAAGRVLLEVDPASEWGEVDYAYF
jgi:hypothetical protein